VRPGDEGWITEHAETIASLAGGKRPRRGKGSFFYRLARRAARTAR
jgi:antitoxin (DNA-binding transcriptional repressor) of toxin-antitoxin stability system